MTKTKQEKTDLFSILTLDIDVENKTPDQFKRIMVRLLKDRKTIDAIESYVNRKLKPYGIVASHLNHNHRDINEA